MLLQERGERGQTALPGSSSHVHQLVTLGPRVAVTVLTGSERSVGVLAPRLLLLPPRLKYFDIKQEKIIFSNSHLQHFLLIDDGLSTLRSEEERCPPEPLVGVGDQSLADLEEGWSLVRDNVPTLGHQVKQNVGTVVRSLHLVSLLDVLHHLRTVFIKLLSADQ